MSNLDLLRPLGGVLTVTGQQVRSLAGVVLNKCIFENCTFSTSGTGFRVIGECGVSQTNYFDNSEGYNLGGDGSLTVSLAGTPTKLSLYNSYAGWNWLPLTVQLQDSCPIVSLDGSGSESPIEYTSHQTAPVAVSLNNLDGYSSLALPACTDVTISDQACSGFYLNAPLATTFTMHADSNYWRGWEQGLSITLGATSFSVPPMELHDGSHSWEGPFDTATVNALLTAYANNSYGSGSLTIGGASPTAEVVQVDGLNDGDGSGYAVNDTATVESSVGSGFVFTITAVDGNGSPTEGIIDSPGSGYPIDLGTVELIPLESATGTGGFGQALVNNAALFSLLNNIGGVTTN